MTNEQELAYWLVRSMAESVSLEILERGTLRPAAVLGALSDGFEKAFSDYQEKKEKAERGY